MWKPTSLWNTGETSPSASAWIWLATAEPQASAANQPMSPPRARVWVSSDASVATLAKSSPAAMRSRRAWAFCRAASMGTVGVIDTMMSRALNWVTFCGFGSRTSASCTIMKPPGPRTASVI